MQYHMTNQIVDDQPPNHHHNDDNHQNNHNNINNVNENEEDENENGEDDKMELEATPEHIQCEIAAFVRDFPLIGHRFQLNDKIGEGAFSSVFKGHYVENPSCQVALKRIYFTSRPSRVENEIRFLLELGGKHNVIRMIEGLRHKDEITLVLEYFEHTNFKELLRTVTIREMQLYLRSLFESLAFIHALGVVHHDIKPSNFLYHRKTLRGALVDFGLAQYEKKSLITIAPKGKKDSPSTTTTTTTATATATTTTSAASGSQPPQAAASKTKKGVKRTLPSPESSQPKRKKGFLPSLDLHNVEKVSSLIPQAGPTSPKPVILLNDQRPPLHAPRAGTRGFRAPEILWKDNNQTVAVDIWSAGVILLTLLTKRYPFFHSSDDMTALAEIYCLFGSKNLAEAAASSVTKVAFYNLPVGIDQSENWKDLCLRLNPSLDQTIPDSVFDLLTKCLCLNPGERITASEAYNHPFLQSLIPEKEADGKQ